MEIKISIIIPVYNASKYIVETLASVKDQEFKEYEIIIVNDCSTDDSINKAKLFFSENTNIAFSILQNAKNKGVSFSRNRGVEVAKGEYIIFLDADDLFSKRCLIERYEFLENNPDYTGCCSFAEIFFEKKEENNKSFAGAAINLKYDILTYQVGVITCPSNYLLRKDFLQSKNIFFNEKLSSSADRFFLLEIDKHGKIGLIEDSPFYYRIHNQSMSHNLTISLLKDNELFKKEVLKKFELEKQLKRYFLFKVNYILGGGYFKLKKYFLSAKFVLRSFFYFPFLFFGRVLNK